MCLDLVSGHDFTRVSALTWHSSQQFCLLLGRLHLDKSENQLMRHGRRERERERARCGVGVGGATLIR